MLINTCVENFMQAKYKNMNSVCLVLTGKFSSIRTFAAEPFLENPDETGNE